MNLPHRSWSFPGTSCRCRPRWHNGVSQSPTSPAGGKACCFSESRSFLQLLGGGSCYLAKDPIVSLRPLGRATGYHLPSPPPTLLPELRPAPPWVSGESQAHLEPRAPGDQGERWAARPAHSWWRALSRIPLSEKARSSAQRITLSNCFPFYSQAGSSESRSVLLPVLQGRREAGGDQGTARLLHCVRGQSAPATAEA